MRSRLSFWSKQRKPVASQGERGPPNMEEERKKKSDGWRKEWEPWSSRTANKPFPLFSYSHTPRKPQMGCVCYFSPPPFLPALLIRQVTTVRFLALGQRRHSLASGTWNSNPDSLWLSPPIALTIPHPLEKQEYHVMGRKEAEWAVIGKVSPQNKHVMVDLVLVRKMA